MFDAISSEDFFELCYQVGVVCSLLIPLLSAILIYRIRAQALFQGGARNVSPPIAGFYLDEIDDFIDGNPPCGNGKLYQMIQREYQKISISSGDSRV